MKKNKKKRANGIEIKSSFNGGALTNFSGIKTLYRFMGKLGLINSMNSLGIKLYHNAQNDTGVILSILILGILSGMNRIRKIENFTLDPLLQQLFGLSGKISDSTIIDRLKRFTMKQTSEYMKLIGQISNRIHKKLGTTRDILDIDSSVKTVYGNQQGAEKGFNGQKKGAKSYHPLMAFLGSTKECLLSWLRPGNTYTANGADEFLTNDFWANEALWLSSVMAYNISVWMRKLCDTESWHQEPATFRAWFIQLAGKRSEERRVGKECRSRWSPYH